MVYGVGKMFWIFSGVDGRRGELRGKMVYFRSSYCSVFDKRGNEFKLVDDLLYGIRLEIQEDGIEGEKKVRIYKNDLL